LESTFDVFQYLRYNKAVTTMEQDIMRHMQHHKKEDTVRLTIDFPAEQHAYLKMLAAQKGISMRQYVIESLCENIEKQDAKHIDLSENKFKKALNKVLRENDDVLQRLASK